MTTFLALCVGALLLLHVYTLVSLAASLERAFPAIYDRIVATTTGGLLSLCVGYVGIAVGVVDIDFFLVIATLAWAMIVIPLAFQRRHYIQQFRAYKDLLVRLEGDE